MPWDREELSLTSMITLRKPVDFPNVMFLRVYFLSAPDENPIILNSS